MRNACVVSLVSHFLSCLLFPSSFPSSSPTESSLHLYENLAISFFAYISFPPRPARPIWFPVLFILYFDLYKPSSSLPRRQLLQALATTLMGLAMNPVCPPTGLFSYLESLLLQIPVFTSCLPSNTENPAPFSGDLNMFGSSGCFCNVLSFCYPLELIADVFSAPTSKQAA